MLRLVAAASSFSLALGFAVHNEDLKFAGASALAVIAFVAVFRLLARLDRKAHPPGGV